MAVGHVVASSMDYFHSKNLFVEIGAEVICYFVIVGAGAVVNIVNHTNLLVAVLDEPRAVVAAPVRIDFVSYKFQVIHINAIILQGISNRRLTA